MSFIKMMKKTKTMEMKPTMKTTMMTKKKTMMSRKKKKKRMMMMITMTLTMS